MPVSDEEKARRVDAARRAADHVNMCTFCEGPCDGIVVFPTTAEFRRRLGPPDVGEYITYGVCSRCCSGDLKATTARVQEGLLRGQSHLSN